MIYAAIDEIEAALKGMLKPIYEEVTLGQAEIREIFRSSKAGIIAGCMVISGIDPAQCQGATATRRCGHHREHHRLAAAREG